MNDIAVEIYGQEEEDDEVENYQEESKEIGNIHRFSIFENFDLGKEEIP